MIARKCQSQSAARPGFSFLELQISFLLLGLGIAGLGPLVVTQTKHLDRLKSSFDDSTTYYLVPAEEEWARKLGAAASVQTSAPSNHSTEPDLLIDDLTTGYSEQLVLTPGWQTGTTSYAYQTA